MDNDEVASALCQCKLLNQKNCKDLRNNLTVYQMSRLNVQIILHVDISDFTKICDHIKNQELIRCLKDLYFGEF